MTDHNTDFADAAIVAELDALIAESSLGTDVARAVGRRVAPERADKINSAMAADELLTSDPADEVEIAVSESHMGGGWVLSYLPEQRLTREQAVSAMALDEMLSDPRVDAQHENLGGLPQKSGGRQQHDPKNRVNLKNQVNAVSEVLGNSHVLDRLKHLWHQGNIRNRPG